MIYTLSIMIPTIVGREVGLSGLVCDLIQQCGSIRSIYSSVMQGCAITILGFDNVEIIIAKDDRQITTGAKRNLLLSIAKNTHVSSCDCDDTVSPNYVSEILRAVQQNPDCIEYDGTITTNGSNEIEWRLRLGVQNTTITEGGRHVYMRHINHISVVRREIALLSPYPDISNAEDRAYSEGLRPYLKTAVYIPKKLYHYRYSSQNKSYT